MISGGRTLCDRRAVGARSLVGRTASIVLAALAGACGGGTPAPHATTSPVIEPLAAGFVSPAHWEYHPRKSATIRARRELAGGACVLAGEAGQRWVTAPSAHACTGEATTTALLAPEDLVAIVARASGTFQFIGDSGAVFESDGPLGPFTRVTRPSSPLARVAAGRDALLATSPSGRLLRWDDGAGFREAALDARVFDVAVDDAGHALALAFPESLYASTDGGAHWAHVDTPTVGAQHVGVIDGALGVEAFDGRYVYAPGQTPALRRSKRAARHDEPTIDRGRTASGLAIASGRAVLEGDRYVEAFRGEDADEGEDDWSLARGGLEGPLATHVLPGTGRCSSVRLGASGSVVALGCVVATDGPILVEIAMSRDGGERFEGAASLVTKSADAVSIAVSADGSALVTGVCLHAGEDATCSPTLPILLRPPSARTVAPNAHAPKPPSKPPSPAPAAPMRAAVVRAPVLEDVALAPAFSLDGHSAYFIGRRGKDQHLSLFVSHDGGASFAERALGRIDAASARGTQEDEPEGDDPVDAEPDVDPGDIALSDLASIRPGDDGSLGIALSQGDGAAYLTADDDGRGIQVARAPSPEASIGGFGRRALAIGRDGDMPTAWESLNGGETWTPIAPTLALSSFGDRPVVACAAAGCLVAGEIARIGWGGQAEAPPPRVAPETADVGAAGEPAIGTPITCDIAASSRWTRIDHVQAFGGSGPPDLGEAARGKALWSVLTFDDKTGALAVVAANADGPGEPRVTTRSLFGRAPGRVAMAISPQMEGYAALRLRVGADGHEAERGAPMKNLEVAWENFLDGSEGHATIADAGPIEQGDVALGAGPGASLRSGLLSVSPGGIFVRPHASAPSTFWVDARGKASRFDYPAWPTGPADAPLELRADAAMSAGHPVPIAFSLAHPGVVLLAHRDASAWDIGAAALAPPASESDARRGAMQTVERWTYAGPSTIGEVVMFSDPSHDSAWASFLAFGDGRFEAATPVPTPLDLPARPRPCSAADRATPRIAVFDVVDGRAFFMGTRHPVIVNEAARSAAAVPSTLVLLTQGTVLHGTKASPCVAAWDAGLAMAGHGDGTSAILSGDLARSFVFRQAASDHGATGVEYRPMTCRFDDHAAVPDVVWTQPGTIRTIRR